MLKILQGRLQQYMNQELPNVQAELGFPGSSTVKNLPANVRDARDLGSIPGLGRPPEEGKWQPTWVFLPGKFHGQTSMEGYSPWGHKRVGHD